MESRRSFLIGGATLAAGAASAGVVPPAMAAEAAPAAKDTFIPSAPYTTGSAERSIEIINLFDLEPEAEKIVPKPQFSYISSGSGDEWTKRENIRAFYDRQILPRYLAGVGEPDISVELLGAKLETPVFVAPVAAHGLAHVSAEKGTAKGAADAGALFTIPTLANFTIEEVQAASPSGPKWFQLYFMKDMGANRELLQRAKALGAKAVVFCVDLEWAGNRESDKRTGFAFPPELGFPNIPNAPGGLTLAELFSRYFHRQLTFDHIEFIAKESGLPVVVKGMLTPDNSKEVLKRGASVIWVSNHGGRQLDTTPASIVVLPGIVDAVGPDVPVVLDSGVRRGVHVFQALALGAKAVAVGRPAMYSLALGGAPGVMSMFGALNKELKLAMKLAGTASIKDVNKGYVTELNKRET